MDKKKNSRNIKYYLCPRCYNGELRYNEHIHYINDQIYVKRCSHCGYTGPAIKIDENMVSAIILLNKAGYKTLNCCQGHINKHGHVTSTPYIMFSPDIVANDKELKEFEMSLPESWYIDNDPYMIQPGIIIRGNMIYYKDYMNDITEWAMKIAGVGIFSSPSQDIKSGVDFDGYVLDIMHIDEKNILHKDKIKHQPNKEMKKSKTKVVSTNHINNDNRDEFLGQLIDCFEDFLDEKKITLNNHERDEAIKDGNDSAAIIYGQDYDNIRDKLNNILTNWEILQYQHPRQFIAQGDFIFYNDLLVIASYSYSIATYSSEETLTINPTGNNIPSGYTPIAIASFASGNIVCTMVAAKENSGELLIRNNSTSQRTGTPLLRVICAKNIIL